MLPNRQLYIANATFANSTSHCQLHIVKSPTPHPIANCTLQNHQLHISLPIAHCQITNSTLANCQLHIVSATLPTCQVDFIFWAAPMFFKLSQPSTPPPQNFIFLLVCSMSKTYSPGCPYKDFHGLFFYPPTLCTYLPTI
jgi:hypothetical protein